jgi:hypothetical protein
VKVLVLPPLTLWYNGIKGANNRRIPKGLRGGSKMMAQTHALSESDFRAWKKQGKEVKFRPCFEVEQTVLHSTFCEKSKQWLTARIGTACLKPRMWHETKLGSMAPEAIASML